MNSIEFGKKCQPYSIQYRELFGVVPRRIDFTCSQVEYFNALVLAIETRLPIETILSKSCRSKIVSDERRD